MKSSKIETKPTALREALLRRVHRRYIASGNLSLPAAPALLSTYVDMLSTMFQAMGRALSKAELDHLRRILGDKLQEGWRISPHCRVYIEWRTDPSPAVSLSYSLWLRESTTEAEYEEWTKTRAPPLFGEHPDAKVLAVARSLGAPRAVPCLDIGAGTGRNALPLAREGFLVDAVEMAPALLQLLREEISEEKLSVGVIEGDILDEVRLPPGKYRFLFLCEVVSHFREHGQLRALFERASEALQPGGMLLFSAFIAHDPYVPDTMARELSEVFWSTTYTRKQIAFAMDGLPFEKVSDESVYDYEKANLAPEAWPPTGWFSDWSRGCDIFALPEEKSPVELRWLLFRRR
jgi:2-polyprenyl-3-methyl-5-hydroxy-6-metoxy-1,4-benzoquinol methylase